MLYPINKWAYIAQSQVDFLLNILPNTSFNSKASIDIYTQVYNYLNYIWQHISNNDWLLFSSDKRQVAFNIRLKPSIELGDDYIFAVFKKNMTPKQEWQLLCFSIRGKDSSRFGSVDIKIDLYSDQSQPIPKITIPKDFSLSFGFNHLFVKKKDENRLDRIPYAILETFTEWDSESKKMLCSLIKFSILNDYDGISRFTKTEKDIKSITTSFNPDKFIQCLNPMEEDVPTDERVLNELPYSYLYPICILDSNKPDCAMVFRKKGRGEYTQFIGKTILTLSAAQMNARICHPDLEDTWLSNENVNRNYEK